MRAIYSLKEVASRSSGPCSQAYHVGSDVTRSQNDLLSDAPAFVAFTGKEFPNAQHWHIFLYFPSEGWSSFPLKVGNSRG